MLKTLSTVIAFTILCLSTESSAQVRETVDRIVAVVGREVITASELANQIQMIAFQTRRQPKSEEEILEFQREVLDQMISDKLFLLEAKKDTTISVRPEEVEQMLDEQIARIAEDYGSIEAFVAKLGEEGMNLRELRKRYRGDMENQLLRQRYIQRKLYAVSVSRREVEQFYQKYKDSIPAQSEAVKVAHILIAIAASQLVEDSIKALATDLRARILAGADFATLAVQYGSLGSGTNGGDLGLVAQDDVVPEFSRAAFALSVGEMSGVIRTEFGYHVIRNEGREGDRLRLRHILLAVTPSGEDSAAAYWLADSLKREAEAGKDFGEIAKAFSSDNQTRAQGGELGWFALTQLPPELAEPLTNWKTPGEIKGPVASRSGLHILKLLDYEPQKELSLAEDFDRLKELARQEKSSRMVDMWIGEIKRKTYVEYRLQS